MSAALPRPLVRVAVFGASGILGSRVAAALRADGAAVTAFARDATHVAPQDGVLARTFDARDGVAPWADDDRFDAVIAAVPASVVAPVLAAVRGRAPTVVVLADYRLPPPELPLAAVLRYGDLFGDGVLGRFRPLLARLDPASAAGKDAPEADVAGPEPAFDRGSAATSRPPESFAPTDPRDVARAAVLAARGAVRGVRGVFGGLFASEAGITARLAAALRARGLPLGPGVPAPTPESEGRDVAPIEIGADFGFRPRFDFAASLAGLLDRTGV